MVAAKVTLRKEYKTSMMNRYILFYIRNIAHDSWNYWLMCYNVKVLCVENPTRPFLICRRDLFIRNKFRLSVKELDKEKLCLFCTCMGFVNMLFLRDSDLPLKRWSWGGKRRFRRNCDITKPKNRYLCRFNAFDKRSNPRSKRKSRNETKGTSTRGWEEFSEYLKLQI